MVIAIDIRLVGKKRTGDETVFFHLTKELLKLDKRSHYMLLTDETDSATVATLYARLECIGQTNAEIISLKASNRFVWNFFTIPKYLFQNKVDIFHTQYILPLCAPKRTRFVTHIHDVSFRAYPKLIHWSDRFFLWLLIPLSLKRATHIIAPSFFTRDEIIKYFSVPASKITVIANGIGDTFLATELGREQSVGAVQKKYHLPEQFVLSIGTLQPRKNIPFLISAFAQLKTRLPQMKLVLVGSMSAHHTDDKIHTTILKYALREDVLLPGFIDHTDLPLLMRQANIFVFPSLYEGFGIPLLEAMSQSVPVAASDIPSLREVGGDAVVYFDPTSLASCSETLYTLCTNENQRKTLVEAGKEQVKNFSWKQSALFLFDVYKKIYQAQE